MPNQEKYILVSLEEEKAKQLANIISNATSRKILDYLSTKDEASETEIAKELNSPLSTIHYNLQQLKKNNLVEVKHFMYSNKGKRVEFYRVVKKFIVIAPKYSQPGLLKNILPLFLISALIGGLIQVFTNTKNMVFTDTLQKAASQRFFCLKYPGPYTRPPRSYCVNPQYYFVNDVKFFRTRTSRFRQ